MTIKPIGSLAGKGAAAQGALPAKQAEVASIQGTADSPQQKQPVSTTALAAPSADTSLALSTTPVASVLPPPALALVSSALLASAGSAAVTDAAALTSAVTASKLGLSDQLKAVLDSHEGLVNSRDSEGRTCLHYAAGYGNEECVDLLLSKSADTRIQDCNGDVPLHFAAIHGHPMCAYNIGKAGCAACLVKNTRGQTPVDVAVACERGEVLNAMLLACAGDTSEVSVRAMRKLLKDGAVPDTWAPNGSSALMLAASVDGTQALQVLLDAGASIELQDALGRSALMFAAGNCACSALVALLDAGACMSLRDRRGRSVLDYAPEGSEVRTTLQQRLKALEAVAQQRQEDLLASLLLGDAKKGARSGAKEGSGRSTVVQGKAGPTTDKSSSKKSKGRRNSTTAAATTASASEPAAAPPQTATAAASTASVEQDPLVADNAAAEQTNEAAGGTEAAPGDLELACGHAPDAVIIVTALPDNFDGVAGKDLASSSMDDAASAGATAGSLESPCICSHAFECDSDGAVVATGEADPAGWQVVEHKGYHKRTSVAPSSAALSTQSHSRCHSNSSLASMSTAGLSGVPPASLKAAPIPAPVASRSAPAQAAVSVRGAQDVAATGEQAQKAVHGPAPIAPRSGSRVAVQTTVDHKPLATSTGIAPAGSQADPMARQGSGHSLSSLGSCDSHSYSHTSSSSSSFHSKVSSSTLSHTSHLATIHSSSRLCQEVVTDHPLSSRASSPQHIKIAGAAAPAAATAGSGVLKSRDSSGGGTAPPAAAVPNAWASRKPVIVPTASKPGPSCVPNTNPGPISPGGAQPLAPAAPAMPGPASPSLPASGSAQPVASGRSWATAVSARSGPASGRAPTPSRMAASSTPTKVAPVERKPASAAPNGDSKAAKSCETHEPAVEQRCKAVKEEPSPAPMSGSVKGAGQSMAAMAAPAASAAISPATSAAPAAEPSAPTEREVTAATPKPCAAGAVAQPTERGSPMGDVSLDAAVTKLAPPALAAPTAPSAASPVSGPKRRSKAAQKVQGSSQERAQEAGHEGHAEAAALKAQVAALLADKAALEHRLEQLQVQLAAAKAGAEQAKVFSPVAKEGAGKAQQGSLAKSPQGPVADPGHHDGQGAPLPSAVGSTAADTAVDALVEQAVYAERMRIVMHLLSVGMTPPALITLLSPLGTHEDSPAPPAAPAHATCSFTLSPRPSVQPPGSTKKTGTASSPRPSFKAAAAVKATLHGAADHALDAQPVLASVSLVPLESEEACASKPLQNTSSNTAQEGLLQQEKEVAKVVNAAAGVPEQPTGTPAPAAAAAAASSNDAVKPGAAAAASAAAQEGAVHPPGEGSRTAVTSPGSSGATTPRPKTAAEAAAAARAAAQQRQQQGGIGAPQQAAPRSAAEAAAAHARLRKQEQSKQGCSTTGPELSELDVVQKISQLCRAVPVAAAPAPQAMEWDAFRAQSASDKMAARADAMLPMGGLAAVAAELHLHQQIMACALAAPTQDALTGLERAPTLALGCALGSNGGIMDIVSANLSRTSMYEEEEPEGHDVLPDCGDISAMLAMSDDDDEELLKLAAALCKDKFATPARKLNPAGFSCPLPPRPTPPGQRRSSERQMSATPARAPAVKSKSASGRTQFAFTSPSAGEGASSPVSIPTSPTAMGGAAPAHACAASTWELVSPYQLAQANASTSSVLSSLDGGMWRTDGVGSHQGAGKSRLGDVALMSTLSQPQPTSRSSSFLADAPKPLGSNTGLGVVHSEVVPHWEPLGSLSSSPALPPAYACWSTGGVKQKQGGDGGSGLAGRESWRPLNAGGAAATTWGPSSCDATWGNAGMQAKAASAGGGQKLTSSWLSTRSPTKVVKQALGAAAPAPLVSVRGFEARLSAVNSDGPASGSTVEPAYSRKSTGSLGGRASVPNGPSHSASVLSFADVASLAQQQSVASAGLGVPALEQLTTARNTLSTSDAEVHPSLVLGGCMSGAVSPFGTSPAAASSMEAAAQLARQRESVPGTLELSPQQLQELPLHLRPDSPTLRIPMFQADADPLKGLRQEFVPRRVRPAARSSFDMGQGHTSSLTAWPRRASLTGECMGIGQPGVGAPGEAGVGFLQSRPSDSPILVPAWATQVYGTHGRSQSQSLTRPAADLQLPECL